MLGVLGFSADKQVEENSKQFIIFSYALLPIILKITSFYILRNVKSSKQDLINIQKKLSDEFDF